MNLLEKIVETRMRLEKRFSDLESTLQKKRSFTTFLHTEDFWPKSESGREDIPEREESFSENKPAALLENEIYSELHKKIEILSKEKESLQKTLENLRKSLQTMAEERNELLKRIAKAEKSPVSFSDRDLIEQLTKKREKSTHIWKNWHSKFRTLKKKIHTLEQERQMNLGRITALSGELDSALEQIAELRDELHFLEAGQKLGGKNGT